MVFWHDGILKRETLRQPNINELLKNFCCLIDKKWYNNVIQNNFEISLQILVFIYCREFVDGITLCIKRGPILSTIS